MKTVDNKNRAITRIAILAPLIALTVSIHYKGMSHSDLILSSIMRQFCYVPILLAALWFGLRGGLIAAAAIITLVLPSAIRMHLSEAHIIHEGLEYFYYCLFGGVFGYLSDREREALRKQEEMTKHLSRIEHLSAIGELAAGLAHEIKNPMGSIKGVAEIIEPEIPKGHPKREFVDILIEEVGRLNRVVENFMQLAKPPEIAAASFDLKPAIDSVIRRLEIGGGDSGMSFENKAPDSLRVFGDEERLKQVFLNLGLNAIEAMNKGGRLVVEAEYRAAENEIRIDFLDNGPGVPPEDRKRIFTPFISKRKGGTGLGLSISERIVVAHDGRIEVHDSPSGGAAFRIILPAKDVKK